MASSKRIPTFPGLVSLLVIEIIGILLFLFSQKESNLFQAILFLVSIAIMWYAFHPISHYLTALRYSVRTNYFYLGKSEMGKAKVKGAKELSSVMITVGTSLDKTRFKALQRRKRAIVYASGAIYGMVLLAILEAIAIFLGYDFYSISLGALFFFITLATEATLSTKSGDLYKMKRELAKQE
ncbi:MAG: hypothetical protein ACYCQJ_02535 [Nitrososphaerales archaeon]